MQTFSYKAGIIGAGKMGEALLRSLSRKFNPNNLCFYEKSSDRSREVRESTRTVEMKSAKDVYSLSQFTFLCVKPDQVKDVLNEIGEVESGSVLVSIAAGISTEYIRHYGQFKVIRAMPNTPALVGRGITAVARSEFVTEEEFEELVALLEGIGEVVVVDEESMNAVTALSGSGPAYVFLFVEALKQGGINVGLPAKVSEKLALETIIGACELMKQTGLSTSDLVEMVASPAGTTIAGIKALEKNSFRYAVIEAVERAFKRARKLEKSEE